jgi:hypothetical protein
MKEISIKQASEKASESVRKCQKHEKPFLTESDGKTGLSENRTLKISLVSLVRNVRRFYTTPRQKQQF